MESVNELFLVIVALITSLAMGGLKAVQAWVKDLPGPVQSLFVLVFAYVTQLVTGAIGLELPGDPMAWDGATLNTLTVWLMAMGAHAAKKVITPKPLI